MTRHRRWHRKNIRPKDPEAKRIAEWFPPNRGYYSRFQQWLRDTGAGLSTIAIYSAGVRWALGWLDIPYWKIQPDDLERASARMKSRCQSQATFDGYRKGLAKFNMYLHLTCDRPLPEKQVNWGYYLDTFPDWLQTTIRSYLRLRKRSWRPEEYFRKTTQTLSRLTLFLRWTVAQEALGSIREISPHRWYAYSDHRLASGICPKTINTEMKQVQSFLYFCQEEGIGVNTRFLRLIPFKKTRSLPKDIAPEKLVQLLRLVEEVASADHGNRRFLGSLDRFWIRLMLHCGLRTAEVRRLRFTDVDWKNRHLRVEQSKGLKDRVVFLTNDVSTAFESYMEVRGPREALPEEICVFRHQSLSVSYCYERLQWYGKVLGFRITPHQLRHSCATLLLNAGTPASSVQAILGHRYVSTTMRYIRMYDQTVAGDFYRAMAHVEKQLAFPEDAAEAAPGYGELLAMVDALKRSTLNDTQQSTLHALRLGLTAQAKQAAKNESDV